MTRTCHIGDAGIEECAKRLGTAVEQSKVVIICEVTMSLRRSTPTWNRKTVARSYLCVQRDTIVTDRSVTKTGVNSSAEPASKPRVVRNLSLNRRSCHRDKSVIGLASTRGLQSTSICIVSRLRGPESVRTFRLSRSAGDGPKIPGSETWARPRVVHRAAPARVRPLSVLVRAVGTADLARIV